MKAHKEKAEQLAEAGWKKTEPDKGRDGDGNANASGPDDKLSPWPRHN